MSIQITQARNAQSLNTDNARFDVEINHPQHGWLPYTLDPADGDMTIDNSALRALIGSNFTAYVAPSDAEINAALAADVRAERNTKLAGSDWRASQDVTMSDEWRTYRQALRDVPAQAGFPSNITWPTEPS
jgi:hypothetical protein